MKQTFSMNQSVIVIVLSCLISEGCSPGSLHQYVNGRRSSAAIDRVDQVGSTERIDGLSVMFPDRRDWYAYTRWKDYFSASKMMARREDMYTAVVMAYEVHPIRRYDDYQEFFYQYVASREKERDRAPEIERLDLQTERGLGKWKSCLKYYKKFTTEDAKHAPKLPLLYEESGYMCQHSSGISRFYRIEYSERYPSTRSVTQFKERADKLLENTEFVYAKEIGFVGLELTKKAGEPYVYVVNSITTFDAYKQGIRPGDRVISVDGFNVRGRELTEVVNRLSGDPGTKVQVTISRNDASEPLNFVLTRLLFGYPRE